MKIGILVSRFPYPLEKGDKLRIYHQIRVLSQTHEIHLCAISDNSISENQFSKLNQYCKSVKIIRLSKLQIILNLIRGLLFTNLPLQVAYFYKKSAKKEIIKYFTEKNIDHLFCQLIRVTEYVKDWHKIPKTLDYMDVLSKGMERRINKANIFVKPFVKIESARLKKYEHFIFNSFDNKCIISEQDQELIIHANNSEIEIIRNGVDQTFFTPRELPVKYDLIFTGNMSYAPNVDGAVFLVNEIMPQVWKNNPNITVAIVGANPSPKVQKLASATVIVSGWVDDIREHYAASKVFIAPMQIGTGLQNKLLEAMSMQIACITSTLANNALKAKHSENILIANTISEYVTNINLLLNNPIKRKEIALNGKAFVTKNYDWNASTTKLENLFLKTCKN